MSKLRIGKNWVSCPSWWHNMVYHVQDISRYNGKGSWDDGYERIDEYLYENFRGRLDSVDETVSCIEFESEEYKTWFILRWS